MSVCVVASALPGSIPGAPPATTTRPRHWKEVNTDEATDTFFLGGKPFEYTEQDWSGYEWALQDAVDETSHALATFYVAYLSRTPVVENGVTLTPEQVKDRTVSLMGGFSRLARVMGSPILLHALALAVSLSLAA